jgi:hypothetical protein
VAEAVQLNLGLERAVFQKPEKLGQHMKPLYIKGFLDGEPVNRMLVNGVLASTLCQTPCLRS